MTSTEQRWADAERELYAKTEKRVRRTPGIVIGIVALLTFAVGVTGATDLRRLQSPRGASLAWTQAAVFGDCRAYLALSRPVDPNSERRTDDELCRALRRLTASARTESGRIAITPLRLDRAGRRATSYVRVRRPDGQVDAQLALVRRGRDWLVLRDATACDAIGCP